MCVPTRLLRERPSAAPEPAECAGPTGVHQRLWTGEGQTAASARQGYLAAILPNRLCRPDAGRGFLPGLAGGAGRDTDGP